MSLMNFGKLARSTMIRWLIVVIPVSCSTALTASPGPAAPCDQAALIFDGPMPGMLTSVSRGIDS
jgi:hypothetical protein